MAEQQQPSNVLAAAFPSPPPFYQHFTPENLDRIAALRTEQQLLNSSSSIEPQSFKSEKPHAASLRLLSLPSELRFLQPPNAPTEGKYRSFGDIYNLNELLPSLAEQGIEQLYTPPSTPSNSSSNGGQSHTDRALILKRIAKSLLLNFLELLGIMSVNPEQHTEKIQDLRTLFINFHHLLNEYRPHQARESLILMMQAQIQRSNEETEGIEKMKGKVEGILRGLGQAKLVNELDAAEAQKDTKDDEEGTADRGVWDELDRQFG